MSERLTIPRPPSILPESENPKRTMELWEPFAEGALVCAALIAGFCLLVAAGLVYEKLRPHPDPPPAGRSSASIFDGEIGPLAVSAAVVFFSASVFLILYVWLFGLARYEGLVQEKTSRFVARRVPVSSYRLQVGDEWHRVDESIYEAANVGDRIRQPFAAPWTYVNGERLPQATRLWNLGFWAVAIAAPTVVLLTWLWYEAWRESSTG